MRPRLSGDGNASRAQRGEVPVDRSHGHLKLGRQRDRGHPPPGLQQQGEGHQPVGAHTRELSQ